MTPTPHTRISKLRAALVAAVLAPLALLGVVFTALPAGAGTPRASAVATSPSTGAPAEIRFAHFDVNTPPIDIYYSSFAGHTRSSCATSSTAKPPRTCR